MNGDEVGTPPPSVRVVNEVADAKGVDPLELDPLSDHLDLESIDTLFSNSDGPMRFECRIEEFRVVIRVDDALSVSLTATE